MATNYSQPGNHVELTAPSGGVESGKAYLIGGLLGVALHDADESEKYSSAIEGVWTLPKEDSAAVFAEGEICYWDDTNKEFDESAVGRYAAGTCVKAAGATDTTVDVKLFGRALQAVV